MFERFTDRARKTLVTAQEAARSLKHNYIGTEHILFGLLEPSTGGVAAQVLGGLNMNHETTRAWIRETVGPGTVHPSGHIPFTPRAKRVLELSLREALQLGHNYIGTEHILLGLVHEGEGLAAHFIGRSWERAHPESPGATPEVVLDEVRRRVIEILTGGGPSPVPADVGATHGWVGHGPMPPVGIGARTGSAFGPTTPAAEAVLRTARTYARGGSLGSHHLLAAILDATNSLAARVLHEGGFDVTVLPRPVNEYSTADTSDETEAERGGRTVQLRVEEGRLVVGFDDAHLAEQVTLLARALGNEDATNLTVDPTHETMPAFVDIWKTVQGSLTRTLQEQLELARPVPEEGREGSPEPEAGDETADDDGATGTDDRGRD